MYLTTEQINELKHLSEINRKDCPYLRIGQSFFNTLYKIYPDIANEIRGTKLDMFYIDEKIKEFELNYTINEHI